MISGVCTVRDQREDQSETGGSWMSQDEQDAANDDDNDVDQPLLTGLDGKQGHVHLQAQLGSDLETIAQEARPNKSKPVLSQLITWQS